MNYVNIGSTPSEEACAQVGSKDYMKLSHLECSLYREQLQDQFPDGDFRVKSFSHDFGSYLEVVAYYDDDDEESPQTVAAFDAESGACPTWTAASRKKLNDAAMSLGYHWVNDGTGWHKNTL